MATFFRGVLVGYIIHAFVRAWIEEDEANRAKVNPLPEEGPTPETKEVPA